MGLRDQYGRCLVNSGYTYTSVVDSRGSGRGLLDHLAERFRHSTRAQWRGHVVAGRVELDGVTAGVEDVVSKGQTVAWHRPPWEEPAAPLEVPVLFEDEDIVVVAKPSGLPTMAGGGFLEHTLVHQLKALGAAPMHRLGRWTSGVVLCSRSRAAGAHIAAQFSARSIAKRYRALASGDPVADIFSIEVPIGPVPYPPTGTLHAASLEGRCASTTVEVVARDERGFLADVRIATGRPHQIRIHLAWAGHPLVGDPLYGAGGLPDPRGTALPGDPGYQLHAAEIGFVHPRSSQPMRILAPLPESLLS